jgi:SynChlorMet cassette protein ScmC
MKQRYRLKLADGQGWEMVAAQGTEPWVQKLASIMHLERCEPNGCPKLIFMRARSDIDWWQDPVFGLTREVSEGLPCSGWKPQSLGVLQLWVHPDVPDVICWMGDGDDQDLDITRMWQSLFPFYQRAVESGGLPLHAGLVERNGAGVLLAANGGTGKSTCCRRIPSPWKALSDDMALIVVDTHQQYRAHPFPTWSDHLWNVQETTWDVQHHLPLSALFFLEQGEIDEVIPMGQGQASVLITESSGQVYQSILRYLTRDEERTIKEKIFDNASQLAKIIPAFKLRVSLHGRFWKEMERTLS